MNKSIVIGILIGLLLVVGVAQAEQLCLDSNNLLVNSTKWVAGTEIPKNETFFCQYGCTEELSTYGANCNPSPKELDIGMATSTTASMFIIAAMFMVIAIFLDKERTEKAISDGKLVEIKGANHRIIAFMFFMFSLIMMIPALNISLIMWNSTSQGAIQSTVASVFFGVIIVFIFTLFYFIVRMLATIANKYRVDSSQEAIDI